MQDGTLTYDQVKERLIKYQLKATQQRIVIYDALMQLHNHPTAENIYDFVKTKNPSISLATVYKTLDTFVSVGLADKVMSANESARYDGYMDHHSHLYCTNTEEIVDFEDEQLSKLIQNYFKNKKIKNFKINDIRLQINGEKVNVKENITIN
ncbi:MAG TPA: transcriptional repressor [Cytophagaceae bacterium]|nr:transcriptional repressor [Cytophagaceae bacterium]